MVAYLAGTRLAHIDVCGFAPVLLGDLQVHRLLPARWSKSKTPFPASRPAWWPGARRLIAYPAACKDTLAPRLAATLVALDQVLFSWPTTDRASLATSLSLIGPLTPGYPETLPGLPKSHAVLPYRAVRKTPWCGG